MKRLWFLIPLAAFFALAAVLAVGLKRDPREVPSPLIDKPAPKFALARVDDASKTVRLEDLKGKAFILNVWGPQIEDAARRDFTVNAMYYDPVREIVVDYHGGIGDVKKKLLRMADSSSPVRARSSC